MIYRVLCSSRMLAGKRVAPKLEEASVSCLRGSLYEASMVLGIYNKEFEGKFSSSIQASIHILLKSADA